MFFKSEKKRKMRILEYRVRAKNLGSMLRETLNTPKSGTVFICA